VLIADNRTIVSPVYVAGHRNPDTDAIGSAVGYAELKSRLDPENEYVPVRLGELNPQTKWVLEQAGLAEPMLLEHVKLRVLDLMQTTFPVMRQDSPLREAGIAVVHEPYELVPVVDEDGVLTGVVTAHQLATRYVREWQGRAAVQEPTALSMIVKVLGGKLVCGEDRQVIGKIWVHAVASAAGRGIQPGDIALVGDRHDAQLELLAQGIVLMVVTNGSEPEPDVIDLARRQDTAVIVSPLDTYVSARMVTLAAPCGSTAETDPLIAVGDELVDDIADQIKGNHHGVAIVVDDASRPIGLLSRSDLVSPVRRRVLLVDHAEQTQSVPGIEQAEIVEILDHHHIGSIETRVPVAATFDPVGSTATLVVERFRRAGMEPSQPVAKLLLGAVLSDTVILNSPTTTERDVAVMDYLGRLLGIDPREFGRRMFEATADVSSTPAADLVRRDAKSYLAASGTPFLIAQIEVIGDALTDRKQELFDAMHAERERQGVQLFALMVTDVLDKETELLVDGDIAPVARAFGIDPEDHSLRLPGVMSRKKQVAPKLLAVV
jgi:manganese-dependent inorganic pyrophosphatase